MKISNVKKIAFASFVIAACAIFSGCQDVIYATIRKEVKLTDANIRGDIRSIVRFDNHFYLANGNIYKKSETSTSHGGWEKTSAPSGRVIKLAADKSNIYALVANSKEDEKEGENVPVDRVLYYSSNGSSWNKVTGITGFTSGVIPYKVGGNTVETILFCTNAINSDNRKAYFILRSENTSVGYVAYHLNGNSADEKWEKGTTNEPSVSNADTKPCCNKDKVSQSCVAVGSDVRFFWSTGSCTNETKSTDATVYYYGDGSTLKWGGATSGSKSAYASIYSMAYSSDFLLVGTTGGISHHPLADKVPGSYSRTFSTNADSTLSNAYTILTLMTVNPDLAEEKTIIYASQTYTGSGSNSAQFDHVCLWAYYPDRHEWNRE